MIPRISRFLMLFLLPAAVGAGFLAASDLTGGNKAGVSVAHASTSAAQADKPSEPRRASANDDYLI